MSEHDYSADERFERLLIDSARSDELPNEADAAWQKFGAALNGVSLLTAGAAGALAVRRAQRWLAAKWLFWGVLTGSAVTAFGLRPSQPQRTVATPTPPAAMALASTQSPAPMASSEIAAARAEEATTIATATPRTKLAPHSARPRIPAAHVEPPASSNSTLAEQVALLDAARAAVSAGSFAEALRLADRYRADFVNGELAPEAEVVAIEALIERGERAAAVERAARFLTRYAGDPHTARVKWLVR